MKHTAGIILYSKNKHLLILKPSGNNNNAPWGIPKGKLEDGEKPIEAAVREVEEETGFIVENPEKLIYLGSSVYKNKKKTIHVFLAKTELNDDKPILNSENSKYCWATPDIAEKVVHEAQVPYIRCLIRND